MQSKWTSWVQSPNSFRPTSHPITIKTHIGVRIDYTSAFCLMKELFHQLAGFLRRATAFGNPKHLWIGCAMPTTRLIGESSCFLACIISAYVSAESMPPLSDTQHPTNSKQRRHRQELIHMPHMIRTANLNLLSSFRDSPCKSQSCSS